MDVMFMGLPFVKKIKSRQPKNFISFNGQLQQFINYASNSIAGAVGLADFLIIYSYYVDKLMEEHGEEAESEFLWYLIEQELQSTIFTVNQPFRGGIQSPFTNISVYDKYFLEKLCGEYYFLDGTNPNPDTVSRLQDLYLSIMNKTLRETPVTFPVTTACFSKNEAGEVQDREFLRKICQFNLEFGFINFYAGATSTLSSCCRLRSDNSRDYFNQFGAGGTKIGSLGVVTLNLPRLAIKHRGDLNGFLMEVDELTELAAKINHVKRHIIQLRIANGNLPLYTLGFMDTHKQYSTAGGTGINEAVYFLGEDIMTPKGEEIVDWTIGVINAKNIEMERLFGTPHNFEQVPAENSSIKLAQTDKLLGYQDEFEFYSNQFIPLISNADLLDRIRLQGKFDSQMTGGAICHLNVEQRIEKIEDMMALIDHAVEMGVIYCAINYNLQRCENEHMSVGKNAKCPVCGGKITDNFTRVVGFLVNTKNFHKVRREHDYPNRQFYSGIGELSRN
jgi:ribonucleoside-triphosphate reductase